MTEARPTFSGSALRRREWLVVATLVAFVALFGVASTVAGGDAVLWHVSDLSPRLVVVLLLLSALNYGLRACRWQLFSGYVGVTVSWHRALLYYVAGYSLTTTPGRTGEALRLWFVERWHGYRYESLASLLVADRVSDG